MYREQNTGLIKFLLSELKPKGKILTPFNIIAAVTILASAVILFIRFSQGLGSVVHPDQDRPRAVGRRWRNYVPGAAGHIKAPATKRLAGGLRRRYSVG